MGVKNLWDILESCKKKLPLHHLQNKRVCIDLSCWMVQLQTVSKSHSCLKEKVYLRGLFHRLRALISLNCSVIFVTDGSIPGIKISTYRRRLNLGNEVTQEDTNSIKVSSLKRNMGSEFSRMIKEAKVLGLALGIPCLDGVEEAEAQCALLNSESLCDGCFTSDSDVFLFGARTVYRDICLGDGGYVICYEMDDIEKQLGFGRNSLITFALLLGSDYFQGVHGLGVESACQIIKSVGDSAVLERIASEGLSFAKKTKASKKTGFSKCNKKENSSNQEMDENGVENNLQNGCDQFVQVIDAYLKPKCLSADSDPVTRVMAQHPFQRVKLHQVCAQFFEWPSDRTDEYIVPKIAERDLRRFANLRLASSQLGLKLPLDQIPIKCPVSGIVKPRKLHGRNCFEVLWEEFNGIKSSIVPADLLESACPEKIVEYEEKKAEGKKQKQKNKNGKQRLEKLQYESSVAEMDQKLQSLLLDVEYEDISKKSMGMSSNNRTCTTNADLVNQDSSLHIKRDSAGEYSSYTMSHYEVGPSATTNKHEVIDLLSPPLIQSRASYRFRSSIQKVDVIDLSESESDASPEHERKAKELRSFIANIRNVSP